jgi:hypothetical protein
MNRRLIPRFIQFAALIILISSCAKISSPTGGKIDKLPPVVIKSTPVNGARYFSGKILSITFNEYVVLDNINDKFMVSPPMKKKPRVFIKGKSVNVEFDEKLKENTTYTFYFQDAIKDLNQGNILENYRFVLSTGSVIDSLSVTGNAYSSFNLEVPEKTLVLLYKELADSAVVKHIPDYISRVNENGYFRIDNVRAGNYMLYALKDIDNSKNYNTPDEEFAFMDSSIIISPEKSFLPEPKDTTAINKAVVKAPETGKAKAGAKVPDTNKSKSGEKAAGKVKAKGELKVQEPVTPEGEYKLILFAAAKKLHYFKSSSRSSRYQLTYILSLPPDSMNFTLSIPGAGRDSYLLERSRNRDTLKVWLADSILYSQEKLITLVNYPFTDTLGNLGYKEDSVLMRFITPNPPRGAAKVKKPRYRIETNISSGSIIPGHSIVFRSLTPLRQPDTSRIALYELSDQDRKKIDYTLIKDSTNSCRYSMNANLFQGKKYLLVANSGSFSSIYNETPDSSGIKFSVRDPESFHKLTLNISNYEGDRIIQLLDNNEKIVREEHLKKDGKLIFSLLESGIYRLRVIYDLNSDGKWTTGDFNTGLQPEPVSYLPKEIEIKPGWDLEEDWNIGVKNFKDPKLRTKIKTK